MPRAFVYYPEEYELRHKWVQNAKTTLVSYNTYKFRRIDGAMRYESQEQWNQPIAWPLIVFVLLLIVLVMPAILVVARNR